MKVSVDRELCIGCGVCEGAVPEVYSLDREPFAEVIVDEVPEALEKAVKETVTDCPADAIFLEEDDSRKKKDEKNADSFKGEKHEKPAGKKPAENKKSKKEDEMKVTVDKDLCIGCGVCEGICPEVFSLAKEPYAEVLLDPIPAEFQDLCKQAAADCPAEAIKIEE